MKDQVSETKLDVWANLFQVLICIARDKPAAMCLVSNSCSFLLHFTRIIDIDLIFSRKSERCPDARIVHRPLAIGVKRNFDLNRTLDSRGITACRPSSFLNCWKESIRVELLAFPRGTDKTISNTTSEFCGDVPTRAAIDSNRLVGPVINRCIAGLVVSSLKSNKLFRPEAFD